MLVGLAVLFYVGARLAFNAPAVVTGPEISLSPRALPWYALLSTARMVAAYTLSMLFALLYGRAAARHRSAEGMLMPLLEVLQSVAILSFKAPKELCEASAHRSVPTDFHLHQPDALALGSSCNS